jgi:dTDP-D-glucose 4,6-dehydratase
MREWCFVAEHMSLVDAMTSYSRYEALYNILGR